MPTYDLLYKTWPVEKVSEWKCRDWLFDANDDDEARKKIREQFGEPDRSGTSSVGGFEFEMTLLQKRIPFK